MAVSILMTFGVLVGMTLLLLYAVRSSILSALKGKSITTVLFRIMLNYLQTMSVMSFVKVTWPKEITDTLQGVEMVGNTGQVGFGLDCLFDFD
jgi:hypothetical protein